MNLLNYRIRNKKGKTIPDNLFLQIHILYMKKIQTLIVLFFITAAAMAQSAVRFPETDKSPMDMSYYPANYPVLKIQNKATEPLVTRVIYSRPQKNGRTIFGELIEYGKLWRLGANEATEIEFYKDVRMGGKKIRQGRYTLFAIPYRDKWTLILNKDTDTWGAFKYDEKKDVMRTDVPTQKNALPVENFSMSFEKSNGGFNLIIAWDDIFVSVPVFL